jgi:hypothetical protein
MSDGAPRLSLYSGAAADDDPDDHNNHNDHNEDHEHDATPPIPPSRRPTALSNARAIVNRPEHVPEALVERGAPEEPVVDADGPVVLPYANIVPRSRAPRQARLPTDVKATSFWVRRDQQYEEYKLWRAPRPRQVWDDKGKNTAAHHRPATNMDLILDLTMVVILARLGIQFRDYLTAIDAKDLYDWPTCLRTIEQALLVFFSSFMILYSRWDRCVVCDIYTTFIVAAVVAAGGLGSGGGGGGGGGGG